MLLCGQKGGQSDLNMCSVGLVTCLERVQSGRKRNVQMYYNVTDITDMGYLTIPYQI
jgi:hypothetical protein